MKTKIIGLILLLTISCGLQALGFRGVTVDSFLNQPLDARIALVSINPAEVDGLKVSLANPEAFQKAGVVRPLHLTSLQFKPLVDKNQQVYIHVTTKESVREPFLNFLLEVSWEGKRLLREYTILLDPPSSEVRAAHTSSAAGNTGQVTNQTAQTQTIGKKSPSPSSYGPVKHTETLWVIAARVRPDNSVSVEQMMMALLQANPNAFRHGNVNFLQQGAVLDIPDYDAITRLSASEARRAFHQQNKEWQALRRGASAAQIEIASPSQPAQLSESETQAAAGLTEDTAGDSVKLRVVETGREETELAGAEEKLVREEAEIASEGRLGDEIAESKRDLEAVREINRDLVELKDALELKIEALRRSLEERNRIIDQLEQRLKEVTPEPESAEVTKAGADSIVGDQQKTDGGVSSSIDMGRKQVAVNPPVKPAATEPEQPDWLTFAQKYWLQLLAGVLLLLVLLLLMVRRRRSESGLPDHEAFGSYIDVDSETATEEHALVSEDAARQRVDKESKQIEGDFSHGSRADVASALTEADIYLAYRRYGPAEELIKQAIDGNPENMILKAKLLEIYAYRKDKNKFVTAMEQVYQSMIARSPEIWAKVVEMGRDIAPDHELITGAVLSEEETMINNLSFDLDDITESDDGRPLAPGPEKGGI